jgi:hypothetical protein
MKLHSAVQNEAIVSNVGEIGEFRIRNSAKAFNILSSGLYANKIRAIIRELSCNAVDSHMAANKKDTPFDVHLPNQLEPYFSIRDYGTGLTHDQVTSIYTTYFESTKTESNDFIGALGLGSKSPFSYTDNFTVTAVKDGRKGIYTAFINDQGVPSIALMMEEQTSEPNGVEVRFAVESTNDYDKFRSEARHVYEYFSLRPVVSGNKNFSFIDPEYKDTNIIPGVHSGSSNHSYAIMGNIKYPIDIPNKDKALGELHTLLGCGLVMEFKIGELDFQASREGLSYIPETITAIKNKLVALNEALTSKLAEEADKLENLWDRAFFLQTKANRPLWTNAVNLYMSKTKFDLLDGSGSYLRPKNFDFTEDTLKNVYNIKLRGFYTTRSNNVCHQLNPQKTYPSGPSQVIVNTWRIQVSDSNRFVVNDTKVGALERSKFHFRNTKNVDQYRVDVYVLEKVDATKPMKTTEFFEALINPPTAFIMQASQLLEKEKSGGVTKNATILRLEQSNRSYYDKNVVWRDAGKLNTFDNSKKYYYLPLSGYENLGIVSNVKLLKEKLETSGVFTGVIYGVRKTDIEAVKNKKNWINLDTFVSGELEKVDDASIMGVVKTSIDFNSFFKYDIEKLVSNTNSPYLNLYNMFKDVVADDGKRYSAIEWLVKEYKVVTKTNINSSKLINDCTVKMNEVKKRYPLINDLSRYSVKAADVAEYINLIDLSKGV